ncbi:phosphoinositide 3-kinase adapter protein 1 isoform X1 [Esox lucius]|uniref:phosphoinositide 3-kinase adapter protein 1 isoform X1 n=1 Tax=Esox lucius TaxID=8010 RepID=UPI0014775003|nr:phosphoinositide 3-kinase adapter protein 1 isoform X1 [Esox lucius]
MEEVVLLSEPAICEVLIVHSCEAQEWATYLQNILKSSRKFPKRSIVLYAVDYADDLNGWDFTVFHNSKCIVLLLTPTMLDILNATEVLGIFQSFLHPPQRVTALLCGISEEDMPPEWFEDWHSWRRLHAEDEPSLYISTIQESIANSYTKEAQNEAEEETKTEAKTEAKPECDIPLSKDEEREKESCAEPEGAMEETEDVERKIPQNLSTDTTYPACLTVQPNKVLCGDNAKTIFIIFSNKLDNQLKLEVEFSSKDSVSKRVVGVLENDYTISVRAPDMPTGEVSLTLHSYVLPICLRPVTYYTAMGEVSRYLQHATSPIDFLCQAFNITSNTRESLDNLLTESLKCRIPATGLHVFGIRQIEEDDMASYQRQEELPTLLHFAAKHGLKKLTTVLLQCPGALQAYSVMNNNGEYPNTLAERNGYLDLRQFMDEFVETADMLKSHIKESISPEDQEVYESMSNSSRDIIMKCSLNPGCQEDIYESMIGLNSECMEDLYEDMDKASGESLNPEVILRKFFQGMHGATHVEEGTTDEVVGDQIEYPEGSEEEDPYMCATDEIYDTVDENASYLPEILNRPPAPIPRPVSSTDPDEPKTYISRVFSGKEELNPERDLQETGSYNQAMPFGDFVNSSHDPYAGIKTPGQRQLIALQEKVKVGLLSVDDAVREFKAWQLDQDRRSQSLRYQQENLTRLRNSITRRQKEKEKFGKEMGLEITAPLQRGRPWGSSIAMECSLYEPTPQVVATPPVVTRPIQRGTWQTGSTSSTSSSGSNRLSTHSTISYSSGTEPDFEDTADFPSLPPPPPRPPRNPEAVPLPPPPRIPSRLPDSVVFCSTFQGFREIAAGALHIMPLSSTSSETTSKAHISPSYTAKNTMTFVTALDIILISEIINCIKAVLLL